LPGPFRSIATRLGDDFAAIRDLIVMRPLLIDRGHGLLYDVLRDVTWLQDANYAKTIRRTPDGQMTWPDAMGWVAGLSYRGITGWRLPDARAENGSGPHEMENSPEGEFGHLFLVAGTRKSPPDLALRNFESFAIYWYRNEFSAEEAWGFKTVGLKQGRLAKYPWAEGQPPVIDYKVLAWPVHDGDVGARLFVRFATRLWSLIARP
jgi:hypothetical protein